MKALLLVTLLLPCFLQLLCKGDWSCLNHCVDYVQERTGSSSLSLGFLGFCGDSRRRRKSQLFKVAEVRNCDSDHALGRSSEVGRGIFRIFCSERSWKAVGHCRRPHGWWRVAFRDARFCTDVGRVITGEVSHQASRNSIPWSTIYKLLDPDYYLWRKPPLDLAISTRPGPCTGRLGSCPYFGCENTKRASSRQGPSWCS